MTQSNITSISPPVTTTVASLSPPQDVKVASAAPVAPVASKDILPRGIDTVKLQSREHELKNEEPQGKTERYEARIGDILFDYNYRGDLRVKFMDSVSKLIYQMPPLLVARMSDVMTRPGSSVSTRV